MMNIELVTNARGQEWWLKIGALCIAHLQQPPAAHAADLRAAALHALRDLVNGAKFYGLKSEDDCEPTPAPSTLPTMKTLHDALLKRAMSLLPPQTIAPVGSEIVGGHDDTALRIYEMLARSPLPAETTDRDRFTAARLALFACGFNCISVKRDGGRWTLVATEEASVSPQPDASAQPAQEPTIGCDATEGRTR